MNTPPIGPEDAPDDRKTASPGAANVPAERRTAPWITLLAAALCISVLVFLFETLFPHTRIWQSHAVTIAFSGLIAAVITGFLVREKERAKEAIPKGETQLRAIFDQSALGIALLSAEGCVLRSNRAAQQLLGYAEEELRGKHFTQFTHPDDAPAARKAFAELMAGKCGQYQAERRYLRGDGGVISVRLTVSAIREPAGKPQCAILIGENVTERRKMEGQLRQLSRAVEQSPASIVITDKAGNIEYVNSKFTQVSGWPAEEVLGKNPRLLKSGETPPEEYKHMWEAITSGMEWRGEFHNRRNNGELYWESASISPVVDEAGQITHFLAVKEDITERKETERQLGEALDLNQKIISDVQVGIVAFKASGECVMANEAAARILHGTVAQVLKQNFRQLESWRGSGLLEAAEATLAAKETRQGEFHLVSTFGKEVWVVGHFSHFVRNGEPHFLLALHDITECKRAEEKLRANEADLVEAQRVAKLGSWRYDIASNQVRWSEELFRIFGIEKTQFGGTHEAFLNCVLPDDQPKILQANAEATARGTPFEVEYCIQTRAGDLKNIREIGYATKDAGGKVVGLFGTAQDITEHKRAENALAEQRNLMQTLVNHLPVSVYLKDTAGRKILTNPMDLRFLGFTSEAEVLGKTDYDFYPPEEAARTQADERQIIDSGQPLLNHEDKLIQADGSVHWLLTSKVPVFDAAGRATGLVGIGHDITERKQMDEQLREYEKVVESSDEMIAVVDRNYRYVITNRLFLRHREMEKDQLAGKSVADVLGKDAFETEVKPKIDECFRGKVVRYEMRHSYPRLGERDLFISYFPIQGRDGIDRAACILRDVTEQKRAEQKIREQATLLDEATDAIWVLDLDERISYWNKGAERIYGWTAAEAIGKNPVELLFKGIMTPQLHECIKSVKDRGEWAGELEEFTKTGNTIVVQGRSNVIRDEQGRRKSLLIISTDITEKKKLEAQSLRSQRMESLGAVAGGIAHDLNNVLTPLMFSVQILKEKITDADGQKLLGALEANVERGAKLVKQVLTFGRGVQGERIPVQPAYLIRELKQIIHETFPKSLEFEFHAPADLWTITGDSTQLYQVLLNLCINARDAMPNGGKLSIHLKNAVLDEVYSRMYPESKPGSFVVFEVTDNGTGIPKEIQDRIFDPFFTTKKPDEGTGLGLSTTLGIVKSHGGFIHCYSEPGKGSTFKVYLPANATPAAAENLATEQTKLPRGHDELVLLVDDEEAIRAVAQKTLERFGYRVLLAANGAEAVSLYTARQNDIAVVVTDMAMPIMDGPSTIVALQSINPKVKIIGSSGLSSHYGAKTNGFGIGHFIPKPYSTEAMIRALHKVLHGTAA